MLSLILLTVVSFMGCSDGSSKSASPSSSSQNQQTSNSIEKESSEVSQIRSTTESTESTISSSIESSQNEVSTESVPIATQSVSVNELITRSEAGDLNDGERFRTTVTLQERDMWTRGYNFPDKVLRDGANYMIIIDPEGADVSRFDLYTSESTTRSWNEGDVLDVTLEIIKDEYGFDYFIIKEYRKLN